MYSEYRPSLLLSTYIDKYWEFKGNPGYGTFIHILPDGCTDFIFTLGEVSRYGENIQPMQPYRSYFVGPMSRYSEFVTDATAIHLFGIRFLPGGIFRFTNLPLQELADKRISTAELSSLFNDTHTEQLSELIDAQARVQFAENLLIHFLNTNDLTDRRMNAAIRLIDLHQGKLPIGTLMATISLCQRHFERKFRQYTGYTAKEYSRIVKFKHAVELLTHAPAENLLSVAIDAGYYDAAHLSKEIKTLSGKPASSFTKLDIPEDITLTYL